MIRSEELQNEPVVHNPHGHHADCVQKVRVGYRNYIVVGFGSLSKVAILWLVLLS